MRYYVKNTKRGDNLSIHESNLKRAINKESDLSRKLVLIRRKRDNEAKRVTMISKKRKVSNSDLQRLKRHQSNLLKYEKEMTKLLESTRKNNKDITKYKDRVDKEQKKEYDKLFNAIQSQVNTNDTFMSNISETNEKLEQLADNIKHTVQDKEIIEYDVFLSHSSIDKADFVTELSEKLSRNDLKVFEDVKVFEIGQSQTDMMNMGILNSRFVVVFLSPNFIKSGWSDYEFKSFLNREINENKMIILPIWHDVTVEEVREYNPYLVDKFALSTEKFTVDEMVEHITHVINRSKE